MANPSKTGPNEQRIYKVFDWIKDNMDAKCADWLAGAGAEISMLEGDPTDPDSVAVGHGSFDTGVSAFSNSGGSDLPPGYAMTVNDTGAFFNATVGAGNGQQASLSVAGYTGGTSQAQVFILLHELGHLLGAAGFQDDFDPNRTPAQNARAGRDNDRLVKQNCQSTLDVAKNIP